MVKIEAVEITKQKIDKKELSFKSGLTAGIPIAIGYIPIAVTFGLLANSSGVPNYASLLMSLIVFAGASQFVGVNLLVLGSSYLEIIFTTFILNFRHFLMTASISQKLEENLSKKWLALLSFGITDESFMVASMRKEEKLPAKFVLGINLIAYASWNLGTWAGILLGTGLPESIQSSMGIALYAMFIGLLIPSIKKSFKFLTVAVIAIVINSILFWLPPFSRMSSGIAIIITTVLAAFIGTILFKKEDD